MITLLLEGRPVSDWSISKGTFANRVVVCPCQGLRKKSVILQNVHSDVLDAVYTFCPLFGMDGGMPSPGASDMSCSAGEPCSELFLDLVFDLCPGQLVQMGGT